MGDWNDGFIENKKANRIVTTDATTGALRSGGILIEPTFAVADYTALQAIPKIIENDDLIVFEKSADPGKSLFVYDQDDLYWKSLFRTSEDLSIMWMGDSLTAQSGTSCHPLLTRRKAYWHPDISGLWGSTLNAVGAYITSVRCERGCSQAGNGTLTYTHATTSMTWAAPSDSAGPAVDVSLGGWVKLESLTAGKAIFLTIQTLNKPVANQTDTLSLSAAIDYMHAQNTVAVPGAYNAMEGNPFGENQYWYCGENFTTTLMLANVASWRDVKTDITYIDLGTNACTSLSLANVIIADLITIIKLRKAIGSRVILKSINLTTGDSDLITQLKSYVNNKLVDICKTYQVDWLDGNRWLQSATGTLSAPSRSDCFNSSDQIHLSSKGASIVARYGLKPLIDKYKATQESIRCPIVPYDATNAPNGNLLTNGQFLGTAGTKGARVTGDVATSWTCNAAGGSVMTIVGTMPQSGAPVARTDGVPGNWARFVLNNAGGVLGEYMQLLQSAYISGSNYTTGDLVRLSGEMQISGSGIWGIEFFTPTSGSGRAVAIKSGGNGTTSNLGDLDGGTRTFKFESLPFEIQAGTTNLGCNLYVYLTAGGSATVDIAPNLSITKVT